MRKILTKRAIGIVLVFLLAGYSYGNSQEPVDPVCDVLFKAYLTGGKIPTVDELAACQLVASRGRVTGYWKVLLSILKSDNKISERNCVRVLGKMLAADADARDRIKNGVSKMVSELQKVYLGEEVLDELLKRAENSDRWGADLYAPTLARSRDLKCKEYFRKILEDSDEKHYMTNAKFFSALGLAQLDDPSGYEWLIANSNDSGPILSGAFPSGISSNNLDVCCVVALRTLSGQQELRTRAEWEAWWGKVDKPFLLKNHVAIVDSYS